MDNPHDIFSRLDEAQSELRIILAVSDLLSCMTNDPPMENTIQETGSLLAANAEHCLKILEVVHTSCHAKNEEEYPDADLSNHKRKK